MLSINESEIIFGNNFICLHFRVFEILVMPLISMLMFFFFISISPPSIGSSDGVSNLLLQADVKTLTHTDCASRLGFTGWLYLQEYAHICILGTDQNAVGSACNVSTLFQYILLV